MKFHQIRSATAIVTYGGVRFLIDPWLGDKNTIPPLPGSPNEGLSCPVHDLACSIEELLQVDAVIATHLHFDHFDEKAFQVIPKTMPIFAQDEIDGAVLSQRGFKDVRILSENGSEFMSVTLYKTACLHGQLENIDKLYELFQLRKEACGVVFKHPAESKTFYLAGDTIFFDGVVDAVKKFAPQIIAVNAAEASIQGFGNIIMGMDDILKTIAAAPEATLIATHMDNVGHSKLWRKDLRICIKNNHLEQKILVPEDNEIISFGKVLL